MKISEALHSIRVLLFCRRKDARFNLLPTQLRWWQVGTQAGGHYITHMHTHRDTHMHRHKHAQPGGAKPREHANAAHFSSCRHTATHTLTHSLNISVLTVSWPAGDLFSEKNQTHKVLKEQFNILWRIRVRKNLWLNLRLLKISWHPFQTVERHLPLTSVFKRCYVSSVRSLIETYRMECVLLCQSWNTLFIHQLSQKGDIKDSRMFGHSLVLFNVATQ